VIDKTGALSDAQLPIRVTLSVAGSEGKKTDEGTMIQPPEPKPNPMAVADSLGHKP
jgi:hypothetical protein